MSDLAQRLADLSANATGGVWDSRIEPASYPECDDHDYPATLNANGKHIAYFHETETNEDDAAIAAALVNAYRAGELVPATTLAAKDAEIARLREANGILEDALQEVGDDYPGSSCQAWCQQQVKRARATGVDHD